MGGLGSGSPESRGPDVADFSVALFASIILHTLKLRKKAYCSLMARANIDIDEKLIRKARKLTRLKTKKQIVHRALELLVRAETRKGILRYYGSRENLG